MLTVKRKAPYLISDLKLDKYTIDPGQSMSIEVAVTNLATTTSPVLTLQTELRKDGRIVQRWDETLTIEGLTTQTITYSYPFDVYAKPGAYTVEATLKEFVTTIHAKATSVYVNEIPFTYRYEEKTTENRILWITTAIRFKNTGNVVSESFIVTESIPLFADLFFDPEIEPTFRNISAMRVAYGWVVSPLEPGEEFVVRYSFVIWPLWIVFGFACAATIIGYRYLYALRLAKIPRYTGPLTYEREIPIILDVVNRTPREITNVVIEDFVPPIARVVKAFDTVAPQLKETKEGTRILWKVGTLKPLEERILTYKIRPIVEIIGTLKLPKACMRYTDQKKRKRVTASKSIAIRPG
jgi:hypothetical protein